MSRQNNDWSHARADKNLPLPPAVPARSLAAALGYYHNIGDLRSVGYNYQCLDLFENPGF